MARYWSCRKCGTRNERTASRKCSGCGANTKPKTRVPAHARTLRDDPYQTYCQAARNIHGVTDESCCVCGKPRSQERHHDRDHGHLRGDAAYGKPRGLACGGNQGCNVLMLPWVTAKTARAIADGKRAAGESDAERWALIAAYLERVEVFYVVEGREAA